MSAYGICQSPFDKLPAVDLKSAMNLLGTRRARSQQVGNIHDIIGRKLARWLALSVVFLIASASTAEEVLVMAIPGEGTAIIYISDNTHKALVTDGGKRGDAGLAKAQINGKGVLEWLRDRGVTVLAIECSHPDSDHLDALVEIVRNNATLRQFESLYFVDSGFRKGNKNASKSLFEHYHEAQGAEAQQPKVVRMSSAEGRNAFEGIFGNADEIGVKNFSYKPEVDAPVHGHTIITETTIRHAEKDGSIKAGGPVTRMVDPDDANTKLVKAWAEWLGPEERAIDIYVVPHHGSDGTDISPILALRPKACVFTVNA